MDGEFKSAMEKAISLAPHPDVASALNALLYRCELMAQEQVQIAQPEES